MPLSLLAAVSAILSIGSVILVGRDTRGLMLSALKISVLIRTVTFAKTMETVFHVDWALQLLEESVLRSFVDRVVLFAWMALTVCSAFQESCFGRGDVNDLMTL